MISKRKLRFTRITPLLGICDYCRSQFSGSEDEIRQQFHAHKCEREDPQDDGALILSDTTENQ